LPGVHLTLVGDGPYHEHLRSVAAACGVGSRVTFHRRLPNDELCELLLAQDIFATHTEYWEFGKAVIEPLLVGLPVIVNRRRGAPVAELQGDWVRLVDNSAEAYAEAIGHLLEDSAERERLGTRAYQHARERYAPERTEQVFADIYRSLLPPA
jgi:glycosyltransferase involved in cell wall biosynthesis